MTFPNLILIRHCQATGQQPTAPLTKTGQQQAEALATFLRDYPIDHITTSQYLRAQQTIQPFVHQTGLQVHIDPRLNERTLSNKPLENWQEIVRDSFDDHDLHAPGGESANQVLKRAWSALNEILSQDHDLPIVVTHGNLLALVLHSLDPSFAYEGWKSLSNPDAFMVQETRSGQFEFEPIWRNL